MLNKIIDNLVGRRNTVVCEIAMTIYTLNMAQGTAGQDRVVRSNHLN